jgi:ketopantoate reductase
VNSGDIPHVDSNLPVSSISQHAGSMALDIGRSAPDRIDELAGFIVRAGERRMGPAPNRQAVYGWLKGRERAGARRLAKPR